MTPLILDTQCFEKALVAGVQFERSYLCTPELKDELENALPYIGKSHDRIENLINLDLDVIRQKQMKILYYELYISYLNKYPISFITMRNLADISILAIVGALLGPQTTLIPSTVYTEDSGLVKKIKQGYSQIVTVKGLQDLMQEEPNRKSSPAFSFRSKITDTSLTNQKLSSMQEDIFPANLRNEKSQN